MATSTKKKVTKKPVKKTSAKKHVKKPTKPPKKTVSKKSENGKTKGLRLPQIRILKCLKSNSHPLTKKQIAVKAKCDYTKIVDYSGPRPDSQSSKTKSKWNFRALDSLGLVNVESHDIKGKDVVCYSITKKGITELSNV